MIQSIYVKSDMRNNTHLIIQGAYGGQDCFTKMAIVNKDVS